MYVYIHAQADGANQQETSFLLTPLIGSIVLLRHYMDLGGGEVGQELRELGVF